MQQSAKTCHLKNAWLANGSCVLVTLRTNKWRCDGNCFCSKI